MKLLALDPSSSAIGYAASNRGVLHRFGVITPPKVRDTALDRTMAMAEELRQVVADIAPELVVIEVGGKVHGRIRAASSGAGQYAYGQAVGYYLAVLVGLVGRNKVRRVEANDWTRRTPKDRRSARIAMLVKDYDTKDDPGGDVADAIGLMMWWNERNTPLDAADRSR